MFADWNIARTLHGARPFLLRRDRMARIIGIGDPVGALIEVRASQDHDWRRVESHSVRSIADAEAAIAIDVQIGRARRAVHYSPKGWTFRERLGLDKRRQRTPVSDDPVRDWGYDEADAAQLARTHLDARTGPKSGRSDVPAKHPESAVAADLFGAAVALVRGFKLLPDGPYAFSLLESYGRRTGRRWRESDLRRALVNAEAVGNLSIGALLPHGGRGAGKGSP